MRNFVYSLVILAMLLPSIPTQAQNDAGAEPVPSIGNLSGWEQCREYLPNKRSPQCRIDFDMAQTRDIRIPPQTHKDITVYLSPNSRGVVTLWHSSPFAACSLTTTPGPLGRDLSANVSTVLTSIAGAGAVPEASALLLGTPSPVAVSTATSEPSLEELKDIQNQFAARYAIPPNASAKEKQETKSAREKAEEAERSKLREQKAQTLKSIQAAEQAINDLIQQFEDQHTQARRLYSALTADNDPKYLTDIRRKYAYSYRSGDDATEKIAQIKSDAVSFLSLTLPDAKTASAMQDTVDKVSSRVKKLDQAYGTDPYYGQDVKRFVQNVDSQIDQASRVIAELLTPDKVEALNYFTDATPKVQKVLDFVKDWEKLPAEKKSPDASVQILPIALYSESKVAVTVKCVDAVNQTPLFDSIQFNAYFQSPPIFDLSAGVLISTLHGREAATQTPYGNPATTSCPATATTTANCPVVVINRTRPQFMPGAFAELHFWNFKLPGVHDPATEPSNPRVRFPTWMSDNAPRHPFGYVGSFGLAGGLLVNPNNGTTQVEFFEGISIGIQRFVLLIGNHNGRSQNLTNGYYIGQQVASGTTPTTVSNWSNGLAVGITYRIPLR